jgi:hypothetical protein
MRFSLLSAAFILGTMTISVQPAWADASALEGTWRGESLCASEVSSCHDERVIYYVKHVPNKPDFVAVQADKIVNGKPVTMGTGEWHYDRAGSTLEWRMPQQVWLLRITGSRMEGTLKRTDGTILRNMTLEKDR